MGFVAKEKFEKLDYDFTGLRPDGSDIPGLEGVSGTTPEPSAAAVRHLRYVVREITRTDPSETDEQAAQRLADMSEDDFATQDQKLIEAVAGCTSGQPSQQQIELLPSRIQAMYLAWFYATMVDPTPASNGTTT